MTLSTLEVLERARAVIARPEYWCTHYRDNGQGAHCALGAIDVVVHHTDSAYMPAVNALSALADTTMEYPTMRVAQHNNNHDHPQVLAWFDAAIAAERQRVASLFAGSDDAQAAQVEAAIEALLEQPVA